MTPSLCLSLSCRDRTLMCFFIIYLFCLLSTIRLVTIHMFFFFSVVTINVSIYTKII